MKNPKKREDKDKLKAGASSEQRRKRTYWHCNLHKNDGEVCNGARKTRDKMAIHLKRAKHFGPDYEVPDKFPNGVIACDGLNCQICQQIPIRGK